MSRGSRDPRPADVALAAAGLDGGMRAVGRSRRPRAGVERRWVAALLACLVGGLLVFVFAGALTRSNRVEALAAQVRAENAVLQEAVEAGRAEIAFIQDRTFLGMLARGYGWGRVGERSFTLADGAPEPAPIVPLGGAPPERRSSTPLDDWMALLFGA